MRGRGSWHRCAGAATETAGVVKVDTLRLRAAEGIHYAQGAFEVKCLLAIDSIANRKIPLFFGVDPGRGPKNWDGLVITKRIIVFDAEGRYFLIFAPPDLPKTTSNNSIKPPRRSQSDCREIDRLFRHQHRQ